jgi:type II secretory pathway component PulF
VIWAVGIVLMIKVSSYFLQMALAPFMINIEQSWFGWILATLDWVANPWMGVLLGIVLTYAGYRILINGDYVADIFSGHISQRFGFGKVLAFVRSADAARILRFCLRQGISITDALRLCEETLNSRVLAERCRNMRLELKEGLALGPAFRRSCIFSSQHSDLLARGAEDGTLEECLDLVVRQAELQCQALIQALTDVLLPLRCVASALVFFFPGWFFLNLLGLIFGF